MEQKHPIYTNQDLELVKDVFADNTALIRLCYKVFYQVELTEDEEQIRLNTFKGGDLRKIFDKLFCPGVENEQIFFGIDDWIDVQTDKPLGEVVVFIKARDLSVDYVKECVGVLFGETEPSYLFSRFIELTDKEDEEILIDILARKEIIAKVRNMFGTLQNWAGKRNETPDEQRKRLFESSNK